MHWDKTAARIILILSVVDVAIATPATVRQRSQDVDEDVTPASEKRANPGDTPQDVHPVPQMDNVPTTSGILPSQDPSPESGTPQLHNDQTATSGAPPSQDDTPPAPGDPPYHNDPPAGSKDPQLQSDPPSVSGVHNDPPSTSEIMPVHDDLPSGSGEPGHGLNDVPPAEGAPSGSHVDSKVPSPPRHPPEAYEVMSKAAKDKLVVFADFTALAGIYAGLAYIIDKQIKSYPTSNGTQSASRDLTSSDVVGRGVNTDPQHPREPVSRALTNLRNEDLRLLSVLTRRALERLD